MCSFSRSYSREYHRSHCHLTLYRHRTKETNNKLERKSKKEKKYFDKKENDVHAQISMMNVTILPSFRHEIKRVETALLSQYVYVIDNKLAR